MPRSSETIGAIAAALAKAQAELTNPEKSLTATIRAINPRESDRTFRYAALSSGLDIVRKALGAHEIATVQTTAIDREADLIRLTTTLAHSSGEWLSSEWPVCSVADTVSPKHMGAALTYARRYALFTLVGIAGEDDLDAPDLNATVVNADSSQMDHVKAEASELPAIVATGPAMTTGRPKRSFVRSATAPLDPDQSAELRDRVIAKLDGLRSADEAADWVHGRMPDKNKLTAVDAQRVEISFLAKLAAIAEWRAQNADSAPGTSVNVLSRRSCHCVPVSRLVVGDELIGLIGKNADEVGLGTRGISIEKRAPAQRFCFIVSRSFASHLGHERKPRPCSKGMATLIARRPAGGFPCPAAPTRGQTRRMPAAAFDCRRATSRRNPPNRPLRAASSAARNP